MAKSTADTLSRIAKDPTKTTKSSSNTLEKIMGRRSQELVVGLCGAIGAGVSDLRSSLETQLLANGYIVKTVKVSDLIEEISGTHGLDGLSRGERYSRLQMTGTEIREKKGHSVLAEYAIRDIKALRLDVMESKNLDLDDEKVTIKIAYVIDQIKNPEEVKLFRAIYARNFYMIGINSNEEQRKTNLIDQGIKSKDAMDLIELDRKEDNKAGQQVEDTFYRADYFIHNKENKAELNKAVNRFLDLVHGVNFITPNTDEVGMYEAFSASLRSACLSRQVGAAIASNTGDIIATGCNDVPKFGGGLYNESDGKKDKRCFSKGGKCYNDLHKHGLEMQLADILKKEGVSDHQGIAKKLVKSSKAKDIIEYSRAVHAEMAAIMQLARSPSLSAKETTLYCTTYPCHNCARHIVAAGILSVVYIEPYEKSLATQLHDDAISHNEVKEKVFFKPFEGVAPHRYLNFFKAGARKENGKAILNNIRDSYHKDPQFLDAYHEYEDKVVEQIHDKYGT